MNEVDYLDAITSNPDDNALRLAYAMWLHANGQAARAEFIKLQIQAAMLPKDNLDCKALSARASELLCMHERSWIPENDLALFCHWTRGFVTSLVPATRGVRNGDDSLWLLAAFPLLEELELDFCLGDAAFQHIPDLPQLLSLTVSGNVKISNNSVRRIARWQSLCHLKLDGHVIENSRVNNQSLHIISDLTNLRVLGIGRSNITDDGLEYLIALSKLNELDITGTLISDRGIKILSSLTQLRRLIVTDCPLWKSHIDEFPRFHLLEELRLGRDWGYVQKSYVPLQDADIVSLIELPSLRLLDVGNFHEITDSFIKLVRLRKPRLELWGGESQLA